jgi:hypothetical protein
MDNNKVNPWMISTVVLALVVGFLIGCEVQSPRQQAGAGAGDYVYFADSDGTPRRRINTRTQQFENLRTKRQYFPEMTASEARRIGADFIDNYYWYPIYRGKLIDPPK